MDNSKMTAQLEKLFDRLNKDIFGGELPRPILTIQTTKSKSILGWFTTWKAWQDKEKGGYYEINIVADYLNRPQEEITETLLHEMVHLYNKEQGIQDCSRGGTYHNTKFKESAEKHLLEVTKSSKYGWAHTRGTEEFKKIIAKYPKYEFMHRVEPKSSGKKKQSSFRHECKHCGLVARTTKEFTLVCGECGEAMTITA